MTPEQAAAYIKAQAVAAEIEMHGMIVTNHECIRDNHPLQYRQPDFENLILKYGIYHNGVMKLFNEVNS